MSLVIVSSLSSLRKAIFL
ncbi:TPA: hypothetical protein ANIA_11664 [Aspergillus nidulans FGSC A4]|uniref:Uncharacterized protein n=1 Tax=Emericella nidulans (strain FGSC A4 / ATCC 38163 / CBS 112.46 / NRRL 194 / M139) TaxID=227321 RepID=C8VLJ9_EMENI|nr:TPA: hypothetical protein ANIA_11664 [Aspergillus nidulans FGSC A4]